MKLTLLSPLLFIIIFNRYFSNSTLKRRDTLDILLSKVNLGKLARLKDSTMPVTKPNSVKSHWEAWGEWGMCSRSCGTGRVYRRRVCLLSDLSLCNGSAIEHKPCVGEIDCPINGGWTDWTSWQCSTSCGPGESVRFRKCTNPIPANGGKECEGLAMDEGKCWLADCPNVQYALSSKTKAIINERIMKTVYNYVIPSGSRVTLPCDKDLVSRVYGEYPNSDTEWFKNGKKFERDTFRAWIVDSDLIVAYALPDDVGLYDCRVFYSGNLSTSVSVVTLVVLDLTPLIVYQGETFEFNCWCNEMKNYFPELSRNMIFNNTLYSQENDTCPDAFFTLDTISTSHNGEWRCHLVERATGRVWTTNVQLIKVLPPRSCIDKLWNNPFYLIVGILGWLVVTVLLGCVVAWWDDPVEDKIVQKRKNSTTSRTRKEERVPLVQESAL